MRKRIYLGNLELTYSARDMPTYRAVIAQSKITASVVLLPRGGTMPLMDPPVLANGRLTVLTVTRDAGLAVYATLEALVLITMGVSELVLTPCASHCGRTSDPDPRYP